MSALKRFMREGIAVALESVPVAGQLFNVMHRMEGAKQFERLEEVVLAQEVSLRRLHENILKIEGRGGQLGGPIRDLLAFQEQNEFVMLPRLLYEDPNFKDFWVNPNHFGGAREALAVAKPRQGQFSFMMSDMMGEQWVYHIPAQTFGLMLQNQAMRGENGQRVMGRDPASGTNWVTGETGLVVPAEKAPIVPSRPVIQVSADPLAAARAELAKAEAEAREAEKRAAQAQELALIEAEHERTQLKTRYHRGEIGLDQLPVDLQRELTPGPSAGDRFEREVVRQGFFRKSKVTFYERFIPPINGVGEGFWIMETQVTQALYEAVMGTKPSVFKGAQRPVEKVSWEDGIKFANALSEKVGLRPAYRGSDNDAEIIEGANGFRLPLEVEWEWAAKGGEDHEYAGSDKLDEVGWYDSNSGDETHPVGQLKANGYGCHDFSGNVYEWCADDWGNPGQYCPGAAERVYRGGSWRSFAVGCQVAYRNGRSPDVRSYLGLGLRLSRSLD